MTPQKIAERLRRDTKGMAMHDTLENRLSKLAIVDKGGHMRGLVPNWAQQQLILVIKKQASMDLPIRVMILKARQMGMSTITQGLMFLNCNSTPNYSAMVAAHTDDSSTAIFDKARLMQDMLEPAYKKPMDNTNRKELIWAAPHRSRFVVQTAGRKQLGRSLTLQALHASELAFWPNATESMLAVSQTLPNKPGTITILESTANGMGGEFYTRWVNAIKQQEEEAFTGYVPVFLPWHVFPEYHLPLTDKESWRGELSEEEDTLMKIGCTYEQLKWRRMAIRDMCGGDKDMFCVEYPSSWEEAFQVSGRPVFDKGAMARHARMIRDGNVVVFARNHDQQVVAMPADISHEAKWEIFYEPTEYGKYVVGADVSEGMLSDPMNTRSEMDYSAAVVYNRKHNRIDAVLQTRLPPDRFAEQLMLAGRYYNTALIAPEVNGPGFMVVERLRSNSYPKLYTRPGADDKIIPTRETMLGFKTTQVTRDKMIDTWAAAIRPDAKGSYEDSLDLYSDILVHEEQSFVAKQRGPTSRATRRESLAGQNDDVLFAAMISLQAHLDQPAERPLIVVDW